MKNKTLSIPAASAILIVWLFAVSAGAIPPPARPPSPFAPKEQNLLTEYERKVLNIELQKLTAEIKEARFEATGDPSLKQLKENLEKALKSNDKQQISEAEE